MSSKPSSQAGDKKSGDTRPEDPSHPGMSPDPAERGRELGEENACGGQCVGTGGHGKCSGCGSRQRVGGDSWADNLDLTQEQQHPGMNPNPAERGRELGEENACGGQCVGTGGHGKCSGCSSRQRVGGEHSTDNLKFTQEQLHPGMNPDPAERGAELGRENADGFNCVGNGGHGARAAKIGT